MNSNYSLDPGESVVLEVKRHWIDMIPAVAAPAALVLVAIGLIYVYNHFSDALSFLPMSAITLVALVLCLLAGAIFMVGMYVYSQNKLVLTDKHLIEVTQNGLFSRSVSKLNLSRVQDVKARRDGVLATILNFGSIEVETAGEDENFNFTMAPNPQGLADQCLAVHDRQTGSTGENASIPTEDQEL